MIRDKFLKKLRKKYQMGGLQMDRGYRNPLVDPYISVGSKNIVTDFGSRAGFGGRISVPFLSSSTRGSTYASLRGEGTAFGRPGGREGIGAFESQLGEGHINNPLPAYVNTEPKVSNTALGLRGIYNTQLGRRGNTTLRSSLGVGMGSGDYAGEFYRYNPNAAGDVEFNRGTNPDAPGPVMNPYVDANVSLLRNLGSRAGVPGVAGLTASYGTQSAPDPGLRLGVTGSAGPVTGNIGYDVTNKAVRAGVGLTFQKGGVRPRINIPRNPNIPNIPPPPQGVIKATDTSIANKLNNLAGKITNFSMAPGGGPEGGSEGVKVMTELTGIPSALRIAQSYKNVKQDPSKENLKKAALNTLGTIPIAKGLTGLAKGSGPLLTMADDALAAYGRTRIGTVLKGNKVADVIATKQMGGMYDQPQMMREGGEDDNTMPERFKVKKKKQQYYKEGGVALPGGKMQPIPGSDAVEFKGASHENGGIMLDNQTEVEGGETMDQVTMAKKGGKRDYFFSSHLKKKGKSFAEMHKDILRNGGDQEEINMLAKMQETAAGRDPKKVAKLGGIAEYQKGGFLGGLFKRKPKSTEFPITLPNGTVLTEEQYNELMTYTPETEDEAYMDEVYNEDLQRIEAEEKAEKNNAKLEEFKALVQEAKDLGLNDQLTRVDGKIKMKPSALKTLIEKEKVKQNVTFEKQEGEEGVPKGQKMIEVGGKKFYLKEGSRLSDIASTLDKDFGSTWIDKADPEILEQIGVNSFDDLLADGANDSDIIRAYQNAYNAKYPNQKIQVDGDLGEQTLLTGWRDEGPEISEDIDLERTLPTVEVTDTKPEIIDDGGGTVNLTDSFNVQLNTPDIIPFRPTITEDKKEYEPFDAKIPWQAWAGMGAGLIPAAYALFHKQPPAEQAGYTPGFTKPVIAQRGKSPRLERYDYNQDIANVGAEVRGMNKYIETSGGGPANMVNKMMAFKQGNDAKMKIRAAETRANIGVQNTEAQLKQQMTLDNLQRAQQASIFNAQMSRAEAARIDQIDEANTARRQKRIDDMEYMKYSGMSQLGQSLQQGFGDILDYKADMAKAAATGASAGNVYRDSILFTQGWRYDPNTGQLVPPKRKKKAETDETNSARFGGLKKLYNYKK